MAKTPTWQRKAGQNPKGGLNEAGRRSLKAAGHDIKRPQPEGGSRRDSFCARMKGMKAKLTSAETANDPDSRINKSLRAWNCHADGGAVRPELGGGGDAIKAAVKFIRENAKNLPDNARMAAVHGLDAYNLPALEKLGGIPNPSIAIANPMSNARMGGFGNLHLIAKPELINPAETPVFGADIYSPRFPRVRENPSWDKRIITPTGEEIPLSLENLSAEMNKRPTRGGEYYDPEKFRDVANYGGNSSLSANLAQQFKNYDELLAARDRLKSNKAHDYLMDLQNEARDLIPEIHGYANPEILKQENYPVGDIIHGTNVIPEGAQYFIDAAKSGDFSKYYPTAPKTLLNTAEKIKEDYATRPAHYFEAKPNRPVMNDEWAGALVSKRVAEQTNPILERMGIRPVVYDPDKWSTGMALLKHFKPETFDQGGEVRPEMGAGGDAVKSAMKVAQDALLALHGMKSYRLDMAEKLGGLPVPSIAVTKPEQGFNRFGDITLVGGKEMATPSASNPVYGSDVYSPRFPSLNDEQNKIFRGFTNLGNRRYAPLTMENVVREMKGNIRGGEGVNYGAGNVRASVTPQFRTLKDVQNARGNIVSTKEFEPHKKAAQDYLFELADKFHPYSAYSGSPFQHTESFVQTLSDIGRGRQSAWNQDYKNLPDELKQEATDYLSRLKNMPTEYFEAKPQRAVRLGEFAGAVVPENLMSETASRLKNLGVKEIVPFDPNMDMGQIEALREFSKLHFNQGGEVRPEMGGGGNALSAAVKMAQDIIKAYHGSPHKFDKFDINKIGTGEGHQAYGHGLYFAENPAVAQEYRDRLSSNYGPRFTYEGKDFGRGDYGKEFYKHLISSGVPQNDALAAYIAINEGRGMQSKALDRLDQFNQDYEPTHAAREIIKKIQPTPPAGHMYEVGINAKPEQLLDWDKPMFQQSEHVRNILDRLGINTEPQGKYTVSPSRSGSRYVVKNVWNEPAGHFANEEAALAKAEQGTAEHNRYGGMRAYNLLGGNTVYGNLDKGKASAKLLSEGIPGIKYLDQGSRGAGEGSSNYVVFDPSLIDIMRRYADGGRIHFDEGGLARIEELIRQAKGEEAAKEASHPVGMSGNVEFAPVEIDEPLTGSKIPLGSLPAPTAAVVNPVANILAQFGPYAMGPIPAGMAAARDLVTGLKEGSGLDVATAAMGAPGKLAKYGLPALGAVTDILSPTEAQAGAGSKLVKGLSGIALRRPELFRAEHPYFPEGFRDKIAGIVSPFSSDEDIAKAAVEMAQKYRTPLENKSNITGGYYGPIQSVDPLNVTRKIKDIPGIKLLTPTPEQTYEDLYKVGKGGTLVNLAGDRSDFGRLTHIGGKKLDFPVDLHAGPKYSLEPNPGEVWANDPSHAGKLRETVAKGEEKGPVIGLYTPMGPQSISSSQHMFEALMAQIKGSGVSKDDLDAFDKVIRSGAQFGNDKKNAANAVEYMKGNFGKNKQIGPWPGLSNPKEAAEWAKNLPGHHRAAIVNEMEKARWKKLGFPEVGVTRVALTDPALMSTPQNLIGGRASMLSSSNPRGAEPLFQHSTYGSPTYGQYLMDLPYVQRQYAMPEAIKKYTSPTETGTVVHPFSEQSLGRGSFRKLFETNFLTQPINQEWLDTIMTGLERQKQYGFNKGGKAV